MSRSPPKHTTDHRATELTCFRIDLVDDLGIDAPADGRTARVEFTDHDDYGAGLKLERDGVRWEFGVRRGREADPLAKYDADALDEPAPVEAIPTWVLAALRYVDLEVVV